MRSIWRFRCIFGFSSCLLQRLKPHVNHRLGYIADDLNLWSHTGVANFDKSNWFERNLKNYMVAKETLYIWIHIQRRDILGSWRDYLVMICERDLRFIVDCSPDVRPWLAVEWFAVSGKEPHLSRSYSQNHPTQKIFTSALLLKSSHLPPLLKICLLLSKSSHLSRSSSQNLSRSHSQNLHIYSLLSKPPSHMRVRSLQKKTWLGRKLWENRRIWFVVNPPRAW